MHHEDPNVGLRLVILHLLILMDQWKNLSATRHGC